MTDGRASSLRVGLTGNIGAGKTTVGAMLAGHGCRVIDADRLGHRLLLVDSPVLAEVVGAFGRDILDPAGNADRRALAAIVFDDADARRRLESILHPAIRRLEEQEAAADPGSGIVVTEASLMVETGGHTRYHRLVVVTAPEEVRLQRLRARGLAVTEAHARMAAQMDETEKANHADYLLDNGGSLEQTAERVDALHGRLQRDLEAIRRGDALPPSPHR